MQEGKSGIAPAVSCQDYPRLSKRGTSRVRRSVWSLSSCLVTNCHTAGDLFIGDDIFETDDSAIKSSMSGTSIQNNLIVRHLYYIVLSILILFLLLTHKPFRSSQLMDEQEYDL